MATEMKSLKDFKVVCDQTINLEPINQEDLRVDIYFDPEMLKTYIHSPSYFQEYSHIRPLIILNDMIYPVCVNAGQSFQSQKIDITDCNHEREIAFKVIGIMDKLGHNAFAFYRFADSNLEFGSIKIGT